MRALVATATVLAALSTVGQTVAQPASTQRCLRQARGGGVVLETCDLVQLRKSSTSKTGAPPATLHVRVKGFRSGCTLGWCQVLGDHLEPGAKIVFWGRPGPATEVNLFVRLPPRDRAAGVLVAPRDFRMTGHRMVWVLKWPPQSSWPTIQESYPHPRAVPYRFLWKRPRP